MKITRYAHPSVKLETNNKTILIDFGHYNFSWIKREDVNADIVLVTHAHGDHLDTEFLSGLYNRNNNVKIICNNEVETILKEWNVPATYLSVGNSIEIDDIKITAVKADHQYPKDNPIETCGFVVEDGKTSLYHPGDTQYMKEKPYADIVLVPIGNLGYTMGFEDAKKFCVDIKPKLIIPIHYESEKMNVDPLKFKELMSTTNLRVEVLKFEDSLEF